MSVLNITIVKPLPDGTPIFDVSSGVSKKQLAGYSNKWSTRWRPPQKGGCPSWIDQIIVAKDRSTLKKAKVQPNGSPAVASSSKSSRDVVAITLNDDGDEAARSVWAYLYVAKSHDSGVKDHITGLNIPIADELWFSSKPVDDPIVAAAEAECNHALIVAD